MASNEHVRALIASHLEGDSARFTSVAMQVAAAEARRGNPDFAAELKRLIDRAKERGQNSGLSAGAPIPFGTPSNELRDLLSASQPESKLADMVLEPQLRGRIERVLEEQKHLTLLRGNDLHPRQRLLLVGPPGCGKTMTAAVLAGELQLSLFVVRLDGLVSKYLGETAAKLRLIFEQMDRTRAVFLFDEFDSIGAERGRSDDVGEMRRVLNTFLVLLEHYRGTSIVVAATNHGAALDRALFRRFDDVLQFSMPTAREVEYVLRQRLARSGTKREIGWKRIALAARGLSYADLVRAADDASKSALLAGRESVLDDDLVSALQERRNVHRKPKAMR